MTWADGQVDMCLCCSHATITGFFEAHFMIQHFVFIIVLPGFKVQWVLLYTPKKMYILNLKTIASFRTLSDTVTLLAYVWIK